MISIYGVHAIVLYFLQTTRDNHDYWTPDFALFWTQLISVSGIFV